MSKRDRDYIPDKLTVTDVPSDSGTDEYLPVPDLEMWGPCACTIVWAPY